MAQLDDRGSNTQQPQQTNSYLGDDMANEAKEQVKKQVDKQVHKQKQKIKGKLKKKFVDPLLDPVKKLAKQGAKAAGKAAFHAAKTGLTFLFTTVPGWIILGVSLVVLIAGGLVVSINDKQEETISAVTSVDGQSDSSEDLIAVIAGNCPEAKEGGTGDIETDASMLKNAQNLYSVFKSYGLNNECIAGILGNLQAESSVDPTTVEGIYDEKYTIGPKTQDALDDMDNYTQNVVFPLYQRAGISINRDAYRGEDGKYYCGFGMVQWTGPGASKLFGVANSVNQVPATMEFQLAYMLCDSQYREGFFAKWKTEMSSSPEDAAFYFAKFYEGNTSLAQDERKANARAWYDQMSSWTVNETFYQSIVSLANTMGTVSSDNATGDAAANCPDTGAFDNSSIAACAVSYAYPTQNEGDGNDGTALYQQVFDNVGASAPYQSCDRGVACAVRWSGSDDTFPIGNSDAQHDYMMTSPKWQHVGATTSLTMADLQPGDVFALYGHVFLYVGSEAIQKIHPGANPSFNSVSASYMERSPGCGNDASDIIERLGGQDWIGRGAYDVFRCVQPDNSDQYKNAGSSAAME